MGGDPAVNARQALAAVDDCPPDVRSGLFDSSNGAAEDSEGQVLLGERANESGVLELLFDVHVHVVDGEVGGGEIGCGVAWLGRRQEGNVPAKEESFEQLWAVEVGFEEDLP